MYLLFTQDHTLNESPSIGDGSYLKLTACREGWFLLAEYKNLVDGFGWDYTIVNNVTPPTIIYE